MKKIKNRIIKQKLVNWKELSWLRSDEFTEITDSNLAKLKSSLVEYDVVKAFYVWEDAMSGRLWILDGCYKQRALIELENEGYSIDKLLPCNYVECKDKSDAAALVLVFDSYYKKINKDKINEFIKLNSISLDSIKSSTNIPGIDSSMLTEEEPEVNHKALNEIPKKNSKPISKRGDLFIIDNRHRIHCGDSRDLDDVKLLTNNNKADMVFTDPPFNLSYGGSGKKKKFKEKFIAGDGITQDEFYNFLDDANRNIKFLAKKGAAIYEWIDWRQYPVLYLVMRKYFHIETCIVWDKTYMRLGAKYRNQHEFALAAFNEKIAGDSEVFADINEMCLFASTGKKITKWFGGKGESNIWYIRTDGSTTYNHPTQKPIELAERAINNSSAQNDIVADLFLGSGTTLIASNLLNRKCY